jgi:hypothetical protein
LIVDLKKRLANLDRLTRRPDSTKPLHPATRVDPRVLATGPLGLEMVEHPAGPCYLREIRDPVQAPCWPLPDLSGFFTAPDPGDLSVQDILFLDTETTGLVGGTGTLAFLVGVAWWEKDELVTRQYFLCGPGEEGAMLESLHELAAGFRLVVTFNGSSFDLPLLRTRALLNRLRHPWDDLISWDLLVPSRRLWNRTLENCRQQSVEPETDAPRRDGRDIGGHLIPQTWFAFLQGQGEGEMGRVLYHNRRDMTGMACILQDTLERARILEQDLTRVITRWTEAWALARIAEMRPDREKAMLWIHHAWGLMVEDPVVPPEGRFFQDVLRNLKRGGDWLLVENVIARAFAWGENEPWLHREAAMLYEHRLGQLDLARRHALAAGDDHRLGRIVRKLERDRK